MIKNASLLFVFFSLLFLSAGQTMAGPESAGRDQLIDALDAAWTRIVDSGQYREMITTFDEPIAGVIDATDYVINQSDCLPNTELTPFPKANGVKGLLADILANQEIRLGSVASSFQVTPGGTTADWFTRGDPNGSGNADISRAMLTAILAEISSFYGTGPITITEVEIPFPFNTTSALQDGIFGFSFGGPNYGFGPVNLPGVTADILDQVNAKGGRTENYRRLKSRRSTCTLNSSGQYIHIPAGSPLVTAITSIDDLQADPSIRICTGNLSTQLAGQYFPGNKVFTSRGEDIIDCYQRLANTPADCPPPSPANGFDPLNCISDIMISSLPVLPSTADLGNVPGPAAMAPSVNTFIVAGTPYWVREDDITCEAIASPPGPNVPFGTYRECREGK
jgi:hypothetical protein